MSASFAPRASAEAMLPEGTGSNALSGTAESTGESPVKSTISSSVGSCFGAADGTGASGLM